MRSVNRRRAFSARYLPSVFRLRRDDVTGAVVADEDQDRIVPDAAFFEFRHQLSDLLVEIGDHVRKMAGVFPEPCVRIVCPALRIGRGDVRRMYQRGGIVEQEGFAGFGLPVDVFEGVTLEIVRRIVAEFVMAVVVDVGECVTVRRPLSGQFLVDLQLGEAPLVESEFADHLARPSELPFSHHGRRIASLSGQMGERVLVVVHVTEIDVVAVVVNTRHQLHARRSAERCRVHVFVTDGPFGQRIEMRCPVTGASVASETFGAHVVGQYQDDVGARLLLRSASRGGNCQQAEPCRSEFPVHGWVSFLRVCVSQK